MYAISIKKKPKKQKQKKPPKTIGGWLFLRHHKIKNGGSPIFQN